MCVCEPTCTPLYIICASHILQCILTLIDLIDTLIIYLPSLAVRVQIPSMQDCMAQLHPSNVRVVDFSQLQKGSA